MSSDKYEEFVSEDHAYGVRLPVSILEKMHKDCSAALPKETGGILVGCYSEDLNWATITNAYGPSRQSTRYRSSFVRFGFDYLPTLNRLWNKGRYYIGEWHFHPFSSAAPSSIDVNTMVNLSSDKKLHCPEPVLIVVGGANGTWDISVSVFSCGARIVLHK